MGTQVVEDGGVELVVGLVGVVVAAGHVYTEVDREGLGADGPVGGYLPLQPPREQDLPGQELPQ